MNWLNKKLEAPKTEVKVAKETDYEDISSQPSSTSSSSDDWDKTIQENYN